MLKKVLLAILDNFEGYVSQVLLAFFVLILLLQIFLRQFGHPLYWTEELARYSFVWFVFFGASYAARLAAHNRVTIQFRPFPKWVGDACMLLSARIIQVNVMKFVLKKELTAPDRIEAEESRKAFADGGNP